MREPRKFYRDNQNHPIPTPNPPPLLSSINNYQSVNKSLLSYMCKANEGNQGKLIIDTLRLRTGAPTENFMTEESLARVRRRLRRKFGVKIHSINYVWNLEDVKLSWLILEKCVIFSHFIIHKRS